MKNCEKCYPGILLQRHIMEASLLKLGQISGQINKQVISLQTFKSSIEAQCTLMICTWDWIRVLTKTKESICRGGGEQAIRKPVVSS